MPDVIGPTGAPAPRLMVVDADDRTRESMVGILGIRDHYDVVGSTGQPGAALTLAERVHPDVVIVDPRLPDVHDGLALIRRLRANHPEARILAVGWSPDLEPDLLAAGADGFLRKTFRPGDLSGAINRCLGAESRDATGRAAAPEDPA